MSLFSALFPQFRLLFWYHYKKISILNTYISFQVIKFGKMTCFRALDFLSQAEQFLKPKTHFPEFCHVGIPQIIDDYKARLIIRFQKLDFIHLRSHMSRDHQNLDVYNFNGVFTSAVVCSPSIFSKELNHCL